MSKNSSKFMLPEGWVWTTLSEITLPIIRVNKAYQNPDETFTYIDIEAVDNKSFKLKEPKTYLWSDAPSRAQQKIKTNDILFANVRPYLKNITAIPLEYDNQIASTGFCVIRPVLVNPKYVFYYVLNQPFVDSVNKFAKGTSYPAVTNKIILEQNIALPPLSDQDRIVEKIEELFSAIDNADATLNKIELQLEVYKQVVYNNAFNDQGHQKQNVKLGRLVEHVSQKVSPGDDRQFKFIGLDCIRSNEMTPFKLYDFSKMKSSANYFQKDQIIYGRMRPYLNKLYKTEFEGVCSGEFIVMSCRESVIADYIKYILHSNDFVKYAISKSSGDRPRISFSEIAEYQIPLCSIDEQRSVVEIIESKMSVCKKIEETILASRERAKVLRQTILQKAFTGSLVFSNSVNESVKDLLRKIKGEKKAFIESLEQQKESTPRIIKSKEMAEQLKSILQLLQTNKKPLPTLTVWQKSEYKGNIDAFYQNLKELIDSGRIKETPRKGKESFLTLVK